MRWLERSIWTMTFAAAGPQTARTMTASAATIHNRRRMETPVTGRFSAKHNDLVRQPSARQLIRHGATAAFDLFSIGHSNIAGERFVALLRAAGVNAIADVRSAQHSRFFPWFSARTLA